MVGDTEPAPTSRPWGGDLFSCIRQLYESDHFILSQVPNPRCSPIPEMITVRLSHVIGGEACGDHSPRWAVAMAIGQFLDELEDRAIARRMSG